MSNLQVPIFYPTYEEFVNFSSYISKIEEQGAHRIGLAKIIPPKEWSARKSGYKQRTIDETMVENPIKQEVHGKDGFYSVYNIQQRSIKLSQFQKLTTTNRYTTPMTISKDYEKLEKKYWQNLTSISPIYGADVSGTFYDKSQNVWNITNLGTILDDLETEYGTKIEGVNTAYLYFGMWKATFAWHTEDMDLYSINYLHFGAPKQWYVIPPSYGRRFEKFAASHFPSLARRCPAFLRHKMTLISPSILAKQSIPYTKVTQHENEFIITFPYAYHSGFNYGFNCAESTNFALQRWIEYGKHSIQCACRHDMVKIGMDRFVLKYQPELYNDWCRGINLTRHPEDEQMETITNTTIIRSSPTKTRLTNNKRHSIGNQRRQYLHQQQISDERYACIFRNLAKFDRLKQLSIADYPNPHIRAALCRAQFKFKKNPSKNSLKLLCLSARLASNLSTSSFPIDFSGLKHANKYRENLLENLWNYQSSNEQIERNFNQWLAHRYSSCAICYLFLSMNNRSENEVFLSMRHLFSFQISSDRHSANKFRQCHQCAVRIHQECYVNLCLALNVPIVEQNKQEEEEWFCQRCIQRRQSSSTTILDDRCSACLLRGGLLLNPHSSSTFIHGICALYQAYQPLSSRFSQNKSCHYCWSFCPLNCRCLSTHTFVRCSQSECSNEFHVTCGLISGCTFEMNEDYSMINARCHFHAIPHQSSTIPTYQHSSRDEIDEQTNDYLSNSLDQSEQQQQQQNYYEEEEEEDDIVAENERVPIGARVTLNDSKKTQIGQVIGNEISFHYTVDFGDGCYSYDMLAEDILDFDPTIEPLTLIPGANIRIKWTDGTLYSCKYLARKRVLLYHVQIDHEIRQMRRNEFTYDVQQSSSSSTIPCQTEREHNYSRRQPLNSKTKRKQQSQKDIKQKQKRRRVLSSSSASEEF